jgi:hypothetical protein
MLHRDGSGSRDNEVILSVDVHDIEAIYAFKLAMGSNADITVRTRRKMCIRGSKPFEATCAAVHIRSSRLSAALARYGFLPGNTRRPRLV